MNRNPSLSKVSDASSSKLYKMPSRSVTEPEKSGLQRGRGRDGREDLGMPKPNRPARKPVLRDLSDDSDDDAPEKRMIRLSFRKGGDKPFYSVLRRCLLGKAWEVRKFLAP